MKNTTKGVLGEQIAKNHLQKQGYLIIKQNYRAGKSEIDIIANDNDTIVFIEVKARSSNIYGTGLEAITQAKKSMLIQGAYAYISENNLFESKMRFDAIEVDLVNKKVTAHIKNAFIVDS